MKTHIVKKGECFSSLARKYGFHDPDTLYSHPDNAQLKQKRPNPNVLMVGDKVKIPDKQEKTEQISHSRRHVFKVKGLRTHLRFIVEDLDGNSLANKAYDLEVGAETLTGKTDGQGLVERQVSAGVNRARLTLWLDDKKSSSLVWNLEIGALTPHDDNGGIQARLNNLGFFCGKVDGIVGPRTKAAVKAFKKKNNLADNDTIDDAFKNKLKTVYGF